MQLQKYRHITKERVNTIQKEILTFFLLTIQNLRESGKRNVLLFHTISWYFHVQIYISSSSFCMTFSAHSLTDSLSVSRTISGLSGAS